MRSEGAFDDLGVAVMSKQPHKSGVERLILEEMSGSRKIPVCYVTEFGHSANYKTRFSFPPFRELNNGSLAIPHYMDDKILMIQTRSLIPLSR
jgi:hypothetical protein